MSERDNRPRSAGRRGRYEVWFLTLSTPDGSAGYWIRYTDHHPVAGPPERRLWFARFDRGDPEATFGLNMAVPETRSADAYAATEGGSIGPGSARGSVEGNGRSASWDLRWETGEPTYPLLPAAFSLPGVAPSRACSPNPGTRFDGWIEVDGRRTEIEAHPGQQGHVDGSRHAERWAWMHCSAYDGRHVVAALSAQGRRGPFLTPFLTYGGLRVDGEWIRLRGERARTWGLGTWRLRLTSRTHRVEGTVTAPTDRMLRVRYLDPDDGERWCHNSEIASSRFLVWERRVGGWEVGAELVSEGTTHAEWAGRTPAPGVDRVHQEVG